MRQCLGERPHGAAIFSTVNDEDCNLLKVSRDGLLDAPVPGVDDIAVAPVTFGSHHGRLDDADRLDRGEQQGIGLGIGLGVARLVGVLLQRARIDKSQFHSDAPLGDMARRLGRPSRLLSEDPPGPQGGRGGATAGEHPCPAGVSRASRRALRARRGRDREAVG